MTKYNKEFFIEHVFVQDPITISACDAIQRFTVAKCVVMKENNCCLMYN